LKIYKKYWKLFIVLLVGAKNLGNTIFEKKKEGFINKNLDGSII